MQSSMTVLERLAEMAERLPEKVAFTFLPEHDTTVELTYSALLRKSCSVARQVDQHTDWGAPVLLTARSSPAFIASFFGTMLAGRIPVPVPELTERSPEAVVSRVATIGLDIQPNLIISEPGSWTINHTDLRFINRLVPDLDQSLQVEDVQKATHDVAFLQFTSGSSGSPKGVMVGHGNLSDNLRHICGHYGRRGQDEILVSWLPLFHDMGLVGGVCASINAGAHAILIPPEQFIRAPGRWLKAISDFRATKTVASCYGYELATKRADSRLKSEIDLSSLEVALVGAEPVNPAILSAFAEKYEDCGFDKRRFRPVYGLAEATLMATASSSLHFVPADDNPPRNDQVACGFPVEDHELLVIDPATCTIVDSGNDGEIWISGPSVSLGYWKNAAATRDRFEAELPGYPGKKFLRTGDIGKMTKSGLILKGRLSDKIIVRGQNFYAEDIEAALAGLELGRRSGRSAVFESNEGGKSILVVAQEAKAISEESAQTICREISSRIAARFGIRPDRVLLVKGGSLPRTSSGKIRRRACAAAYENDEFQIEFAAEPAQLTFGHDRSKNFSERILEMVSARMATALSYEDLARPFQEIGLVSADIAELLPLFEAELGVTISEQDFFASSSIADLLEHVGRPKAAHRCKSDRAATSWSEPIAIVGLSCRYPSATDPEQFWRMVQGARSSLGGLPKDRPELAAALRDLGLSGGFLDGVERFDAGFFQMSEREAAQMDPQHRLALELSWEAFEDAGIRPSRVKDKSFGVFVGVSSADYSHQFAREQLDLYGILGNSPSSISSRISYFYDFKGPSVSIDTACASSLTATHLACQSLLSGESDLCLAGGVSLILAPEVAQAFKAASLLSPTNHSMPFSTQANGYVRSEGAGLVMLKRLSDAMADGDRVYATIKGSAIGHNGRTNGPISPSARAQVQVIRAALEIAGCDPATIGYVEGHGTGTILGDRVELSAIADVYGRRDDGHCQVGSIKANIGHTEAAAGSAGLIKMALALKNKEFPPLAVDESSIDNDGLSKLGLCARSEPATWHASQACPRRAAVSSLGFSGAIAHLILEQSPPAPTPRRLNRDTNVAPLIVSGHTQDAARLRGESIRRRMLENNIVPAEAAVTLANHIEPQRYRIAVNAPVERMKESLDRLVDPRAIRDSASAGKLAFLFTGKTAELWDLQALRNENNREVLQATLNEADAYLRTLNGMSLQSMAVEAKRLTGASQNSEAFTQPIHVAVQVALARQMLSEGIAPDVVFGTSIGEVSAACFANAMSFFDALKLSILRGQCMHDVEQGGKLALIAAPRWDVERQLIRNACEVWISGVNGPDQTIVGGRAEDIMEIVSVFNERDVFAREISSVNVAAHTPLMVDASKRLESLLGDSADLVFREPDVPLLSTCQPSQASPSLDAQYWAANLLQPVDFQSAAELSFEIGARNFIEIAPKSGLRQGLNGCARQKGIEVESACVGMPGLPISHGLNGCAALAFENGCSLDYPQNRDVFRPDVVERYPWRKHSYSKGTQIAAQPVVSLELKVVPSDSPSTISATFCAVAAEINSGSPPHRHAIWLWGLMQCAMFATGRIAIELSDIALAEHVDARDCHSERLTLLITATPEGSGWQISIEQSDVLTGRYEMVGQAIVVGSAHDVGPTASQPSISYSVQDLDRQIRQANNAVKTARTDSSGAAAIEFHEKPPIRNFCVPRQTTALLCYEQVQARIQLESEVLASKAHVCFLGSNKELQHAIAASDTTLAQRMVRLNSAAEIVNDVFPAGERVEIVFSPSAGAEQSVSSELFILRQLLSAVRAGSGIHGRIWIVSSQSQGSPQLSAILASGLTLAAEIGDHFASAVELEAFDPANVKILAELLSADRPPIKCTIREGALFEGQLRRLPQRYGSTAFSPLRSDATYVITGAFGGLGRELAKQLGEWGCRNLVLLSSSEERIRSDEAQALLRSLRGTGCTATAYAVDLNDQDKLALFLSEAVSGSERPIRGIFHLAGVVDYQLFENLELSDAAKIWTVKAETALTIDKWSKQNPLDHFVMFSSIASIIPSPALGAYVAANAALDRLAEERRSRGLAALSINWGMWLEVGMAARTLQAGEMVATRGGQGLTTREGLTVLSRLLQEDIASAVVAKANWNCVAKGREWTQRSSLLDRLVDPLESAGLPDQRDQLLTVEDLGKADDATQLHQIILSDCLNRFAAVLGTTNAAVTRDQPLEMLGIDSLMAIELRNRLEADYAIQIDPALFFQGLTIDEFAGELAAQFLSKSTCEKSSDEIEISDDEINSIFSE